MTKEQSCFSQAFTGTNPKIPVWFMRQAGRYSANYQKIRQKYPLEEMFQTPELAAEITLQPIHEIGVDAAILFADILTLPTAMGADIKFDSQKGPVVSPIDQIKHLNDIDDVKHIRETIALVNDQLSDDIPLIGFAGSPWTVLTYLIEGGSSMSYFKTFEFMNSNQTDFHALMEKLTENTIRYAELQINAGIDAFQLFESWGGIVPLEVYQKNIFPYVQRIFQELQIPSIYFIRQARHLLPLLFECGSDFLSIDHTIDIEKDILNQTEMGVQGNFFNGLLYADDQTIVKEVQRICRVGKKHQKFIFNLSHGVFPTVDANKLKLIVETVHNFNS